MIWILRLFSQFRALESQVRELASDKIVFQDKERWYQAQIDDLTAQAAKNTEAAVEGAQSVADFVAQYTLGRKIFGVGPDAPPPPQQPEPISRDSVQARDIEDVLNSPEYLSAMIEQAESEAGVAQ